MPATDFEVRHPLLLHQLIVGWALLTYLFDPEDVVWRFVKNSGAHARPLERSLFAIATLLFGISALICTLARAYSGRDATTQAPKLANGGPFRSLRALRYFGDFLYAVALGSLLPLSGFLILVIGETIRLFRLPRRDHRPAQGERGGDDTSIPDTSKASTSVNKPPSAWAKAFRREAIKWGFFLTMIVFSVTLKDRVAETLIGITVLLWAILNARTAAGSREKG